MIVTTEIRQMPLPEKLALLESLWSELAAEPDQIEIPQWHKDILDERMRAAENGTAELIAWDTAKEQIQKMIR